MILLQNNTILLNAKNYKKYITQDRPLCNISFSKDCLNGPSSLLRTAYPDDYTHLQMFNFFRLAPLQVQVANRDDLQKNQTWLSSVQQPANVNDLEKNFCAFWSDIVSYGAISSAMSRGTFVRIQVFIHICVCICMFICTLAIHSLSCKDRSWKGWSQSSLVTTVLF